MGLTTSALALAPYPYPLPWPWSGTGHVAAAPAGRPIEPTTQSNTRS